MDLLDVLEKLPIGIGTIKDRTILSVNERICNELGYSREELVGQNISILYYDQEQFDLMGKSFYSMLNQKDLAHLELNLKRKDGSPVFISAGILWQDNLDHDKGIIFYAHKFSDKSSSTIAIQENERRFLQAGKFANFGVWEINLDTGKVIADKTYRDLMGYSDTDKFETSEDWLQSIARKEDRKASRILLRQLSSGEIDSLSVEHKARKKDGSIIQSELTAEVVHKNKQKHLVGFSRDITEYYNMREALKKQREEYRFIVDSTSAILFSADPVTLQYDFISNEAESLLGYPVERFINEADFFTNHIHPDDKQRVIDYFTRMNKKALSHSMDYRFIRADGTVIWLHDTANIVTGINQENRVAGALFDITAQKEAEEQLRTLSNVVEQSPDAIILTDEHFNIVYINQTFTRIFGYRLYEITEQTPGLLCAHDEKEAYLSQLADKLRKGENIFDVTLLHRKDQSSLVCQFWIFVLRDNQNKIIGHVGSLRDITTQVQQEQAIKKAEARYRMLYEHIPQGVVLLDANSHVITANPAAETILGHIIEPGFNLLNIDPEHPLIHEDGSIIDAEEQFATLPLKTGLASKNQVTGFYNPQKKAYIWLNVDTVPMLNETTLDFDQVFLSFSDITESTKLQQALIKQQRMEAVGHLTGGIAHEFNNILGSILGFTELARMNFGSVDKKLDNYLNQIETAGGRARDLIRELMIFSRGENTHKATPQSLIPQIENSIKLLRPILGSNIYLDTHFPPAGPSIEIDPLHLQQLLMNICLNARDAMQGSGRLSISVDRHIYNGETCDLCNQKITGEWTQISISDSGKGISADIINDIFQPFVSTKEIGEGSGMGLAVVKGIVETYHGHILTNTSASGTTFLILLPLSESESSGRLE